MQNSKDLFVWHSLRDNELLGMAFSAPLKANPLERGVRQDPSFEDDNVLYMIDTTISPEFQGRGQGRFLKYALQVIATSEGKTRIHGRNRDRLAAGMLLINLSMGCYEQLYLKRITLTSRNTEMYSIILPLLSGILS